MSSYELYQLKLQCYIQAKEAAEAYVREYKSSNFETKGKLSTENIIREAEKIYIFVTKH